MMHGRFPVTDDDGIEALTELSASAALRGNVAPNNFPVPAAIPPASAPRKNFLRVQICIVTPREASNRRGKVENILRLRERAESSRKAASARRTHCRNYLRR